MFVRAAELRLAARRRGVPVRGTIDCVLTALCAEQELALLHRDRDLARLAPLGGVHQLAP